MRHVDFHVDSSIILRIDYLRGELQPTSPDRPPYFDDKQSFLLSIDSARIEITPGSLSDLLNRNTFAYPGSPLQDYKRTPPVDRSSSEKRYSRTSVSELRHLERLRLLLPWPHG